MAKEIHRLHWRVRQEWDTGIQRLLPSRILKAWVYISVLLVLDLSFFWWQSYLWRYDYGSSYFLRAIWFIKSLSKPFWLSQRPKYLFDNSYIIFHRSLHSCTPAICFCSCIMPQIWFSFQKGGRCTMAWSIPSDKSLYPKSVSSEISAYLVFNGVVTNDFKNPLDLSELRSSGGVIGRKLRWQISKVDLIF